MTFHTSDPGVCTSRIFDEWVLALPLRWSLWHTPTKMFPILGEEGRKLKVAWRAANARTAVPYFKITKKAAKQTIPLRHRHPPSRTDPHTPVSTPETCREEGQRVCVRGSKERFNLSEPKSRRGWKCLSALIVIGVAFIVTSSFFSRMTSLAISSGCTKTWFRPLRGEPHAEYDCKCYWGFVSKFFQERAHSVGTKNSRRRRNDVKTMLRWGEDD